jgi:hypothetical protein
MTAIASYLVVQDCQGSPANYWEASYSQSTGNNVDFLIYSGGAPVSLPVDVNYLDVQDCQGSPVDTWYVNQTSVDSGNNDQIYFYTSPVTDIQIYGAASVVASGTRTRTIFDSIVGFVDASCNAVAENTGNASINGEASMSSSSGRQTNGSAAISGNGQISANGKIIGEEWTEIPQETEVWYEN